MKGLLKKNSLKNVALGFILAILSVIAASTLSGTGDLTDMSYEEIVEIKADITIDSFFFSDAQGMMDNGKQLMNAINNIMLAKSLGIFEPLEKKEFNVLINSGGGLVDESMLYTDILLIYKQLLGVKFKCHIKQAMSAAFTFALRVCDTRVGLENVELMQHRVTIGSYNSIETKLLDMSIAKLEAGILDIEYSKWLALTKNGEDHYFTHKEMKKYKLIHTFQGTVRREPLVATPYVRTK